MRGEKPKVSVVVASHNARASIEACLTALEAQRPEDAEIIVVDNSTDGTTEIIKKQFPHISLVVEPPSALIPELWQVGIRQSTAEIVAITTAHCFPGKDWVIRILQAHKAPVSAIGGAIENDESTGIIDWAVYFCRYSQYMLPFSEGFVAEIPGDNASYKRVHLDRCRHAWRNGFWEPAVHAELKKAGLKLLLTPLIIVYHKRSFGFWEFMKQRFQHGMAFGIWRVSQLAGPKQVFYIIFSPMIPLILLARIARQVMVKRRHWEQFLVSLPFLVPFLLAWSIGELVGYLRGPTG